MATPSRSINVDQLTYNTVIAKPDGTPTPEFMQQWNLLRQYVTGANGQAITTQSPITGGGNVSDPEPIGLEDSGVTPDTYGDASNVPQITVDQWGRITEALNIPFSAGGAEWVVNAIWDFAIDGATASVPASGLAGKADIIVVFIDVTTSVSEGRNVQVSVDNGSTWLGGASDYQRIAVTGVPTNASAMGLISTNSSAARTAFVMVSGCNIAPGPKVGQGTRQETFIIPAANANDVDAIRAVSLSGNFNGGAIVIMSR